MTGFCVNEARSAPPHLGLRGVAAPSLRGGARARERSVFRTTEVAMKASCQVVMRSLCIAALATGIGHAATTVDYSDQWWVPSESGWGASVLQQTDVLFVSLFIYGSDGRPVWLTAAGNYRADSPVGHQVFAGELYRTVGPYYGGPWNPAAVGYRKVGTLAFDATSPASATLSYTVDGTPVVKSVTRQTWSFENFTGTYDAIWENNCDRSEWPGSPLDGFSSTVIVHGADNRVAMSIEYPFYLTDDRQVLRGTYTQSGRLGQIAADLVAPAAGSITIVEIARSAAGFTARFTGSIPLCQITDGRIVATYAGP
jgi:hypothetical protein